MFVSHFFESMCWGTRGDECWWFLVTYFHWFGGWKRIVEVEDGRHGAEEEGENHEHGDFDLLVTSSSMLLASQLYPGPPAGHIPDWMQMRSAVVPSQSHLEIRGSWLLRGALVPLCWIWLPRVIYGTRCCPVGINKVEVLGKIITLHPLSTPFPRF